MVGQLWFLSLWLGRASIKLFKVFQSFCLNVQYEMKNMSDGFKKEVGNGYTLGCVWFIGGFMISVCQWGWHEGISR